MFKAVFCTVSTGLTLVSVGFLHGWPLVSMCDVPLPVADTDVCTFTVKLVVPVFRAAARYSCFSSLDMNHQLWHMQGRSTLLINSSINATDVWSVSSISDPTATTAVADVTTRAWMCTVTAAMNNKREEYMWRGERHTMGQLPKDLVLLCHWMWMLWFKESAHINHFTETAAAESFAVNKLRRVARLQ